MSTYRSKEEVGIEIAALKKAITGARDRMAVRESFEKLPERASFTLNKQISIWEARLSKLQSGAIQ